MGWNYLIRRNLKQYSITERMAVDLERYIKHIIESADKRIDNFLKMQVKDINDRFYGGIKDDILDIKPTVYISTTAVAVYLNKSSRYYLNEELYKSIDIALSFIRRYQRPDGSFDYPSCNFKSAPDTAFCFKRLISAYRLLIAEEDIKCKQLADKHIIIMQDALIAIESGGFHTPNHRWAITAALIQGAGRYNNKSQAEKYIKKAEQYLAEGIDGNEDGEYAERSTGNYNAVVNNAMISLYEETKDESYLKYVEKNLHMMLTYIDPDDTIFTQNSTRQDKGKPIYADKYFYQYLYMACIKPNAEFDAVAHKLIKDNMERGDLAPDCLHIIMQHPVMSLHQFKSYGFPSNYKVHYKDSGVLRVKKEELSYSILNKNADFFFMKLGRTQISIRIGISFCEIRNFIPNEMNVTKDTVELYSKANGWYYLPFNEKQETTDWHKMDHSKRDILVSSHIKTKVLINEKPNSLEFNIKTEGIDRLPLRVEICIPEGSILENDHFYQMADEGQSIVLKDDYIVITDRQNKLKIGPGYGAHTFKKHYSEEGTANKGYTIYLNEYTPCDMVFSVEY